MTSVVLVVSTLRVWISYKKFLFYFLCPASVSFFQEFETDRSQLDTARIIRSRLIQQVRLMQYHENEAEQFEEESIDFLQNKPLSQYVKT